MHRLSSPVAYALIPVAALIGIAFALYQWYLVSKIKVSVDNQTHENGNGNVNGENDTHEMEEGVDGRDVRKKCAEIQEAVSIGEHHITVSVF
ncbi:hypothetical protein LUZ63_019038 [Rhynchospora breviuscula]|uniref:Uncharacterized protein n=1 Tax=Rhynchospora breviuscula TaxID=2022672 RepID=A0A9Q0C5H3_9POAL|nr:hypothetical protein LUZ63_019038 [Rhynchospora breviuscula]